MDSSAVKHEEYNAFHAMDRALYSILAIELWRNPYESIQIVILWLWFEKLGFKNVVEKILSLPRIVINELADEALICYRCIKDPRFLHSSKAPDIPLTRNILKRKMSLEYFCENRETVIRGIHKIGDEICGTALADVIAAAITRHSAQKPVKKQNMSPAVDQSLVQSFSSLGFVSELPKGNSSGKTESLAAEPSLVHNFSNLGFAGEITQGNSHSIWAPLDPHQSSGHTFANMGRESASSSGSSHANMVPPTLQRSLNHMLAKMGLKGSGFAGNEVPPRFARSSVDNLGNLGLSGEISNCPILGTPPPSPSPAEQTSVNRYANVRFGAEMFKGFNPGNVSPPENRTLFVTFSKGYPVSESEVRDFFTRLFGDCIESFHMQTVMPNEQALYARIVFNNADIIDSVLNGLQKAKYTISGKHIWMRRFVAKRGGSSSSSSRPWQ